MKDQNNDPKEKPSGLRRPEELTCQEKSSGISDASALSPEKVRQLIHELQVRQVELETLNEELRQTQVALEASNDKYLTII